MKQFSMRMVGNLTRLILVLLLILGQAACSNATQPVPTSVTGNENVVITFANYEFNRSIYEPLMAEFHKQNPNITAQFVPLPESFEGNASTSDYYRQLASAADTSLAFARGSEVSSYFRDLSPQIDSDSSFKPDDFWSGALTACQDAGGHTWGIPIHLFLTGIYYDEQAFAAPKLTCTRPDQFLDNACVGALEALLGLVVWYGSSDTSIYQDTIFL